MVDVLKTLVTDLSFPEGPRWHPKEKRLYFSDFYREQVLAVDEAGHLEVICHIPQQPSGLGWLPNGDLLIVSMINRQLLRLTASGELELYANLSDLATWHCNDMVVANSSRASVSNFAFDTHGDLEPVTADLVMVDTNGHAQVAATDLWFPNGAVITPEGTTLIIAETRAAQLTAFDVDEAGGLSNRRLWANIEPHVPDGMCLDAEGAVWVADPRRRAVIRVREGGEIIDRIDTGARGAYACMLGGDDGTSLFICTATGSGPHAKANREGQIDMIKVGVPHAGLP